MSDVDQESKTEEATPRKKEQLREKGQVAISADVAGAATVVAVLATIAAFGEGWAMEVAQLSERTFSLRDAHRPLVALRATGALLASTVAPVAGAAAIAAIAASVAQTRGLFSLASLAPKPERLDPVEGMKKVLPGPKMFVETGKSLLKVTVVGLLVWQVVDEALPRLVVLPSTEPVTGAGEVARMSGRLLLYGVGALAALAAIDYGIAWRRFHKDARMAKHEVKEEHKQAEGDPHIKAKRRQRQRELAKNRTVQAAREATVLVTNPTHIAVALRYRPEEGDGAPIMLAHGVDAVALRMRAEARKHGVPIVENKPLARALRATGKVGRPIPVELYETAARVIAHVMQIGQRVGGDA